jgi:hypothetical protein
MSSYVFVSDLFSEDYVGGAELTTDAIIKKFPNQSGIIKIKSHEVTLKKIDELKDHHWIICNFSNLSESNKLNICKNIQYSIIEYDYKFCKYRSIELHKIKEGIECNCKDLPSSKINLAFYGLAKKIWFMSNTQREIFFKNVKTIKQEKTEVLSSVFSDGDLRFINSIKDNEKDSKYLIVKSNSWVKGFDSCLSYAKENNLKYEVVQKLPYHELLIKLSTSKGLIFLPDGADTCPRLVIEAKLLGCELILNDLVQHKNEDWFSDNQACLEYMSNRASNFWSYYEQ